MTTDPASPDPAWLVFPRSARDAQERLGSRRLYAGRDEPGSVPQVIDQRLIDFIARLDTLFIATATADGAPYIQHRGGPPGFLRAVDERTLGFADLAGNRQYITLGRLSENDRVCLFLIDYANQARIKIWGRARVATADGVLAEALAIPGYRARVERAILITVGAWDINCPQHIPRKVNLSDVQPLVANLQARVGELEAEVERLRSAPNQVLSLRT